MKAFPIPAGVQFRYCGFWGDPRGGGTRSHQGVDLCCAEGTPLLACDDGVVHFGNDPLGGIVAMLYPAAGGRHWYYAHMSRVEGAARPVVAGDVIGYVGHTGDAVATLPHLHFGEYTAGGAVNPLAELQAAPRVSANSTTSLWKPIAIGAVLLAAAAGAASLLRSPRRRRA